MNWFTALINWFFETTEETHQASTKRPKTTVSDEGSKKKDTRSPSEKILDDIFTASKQSSIQEEMRNFRHSFHRTFAQNREKFLNELKSFRPSRNRGAK